MIILVNETLVVFNGVEECCEGHSQLHEKLEGEATHYIGKRHATRLMNDAYGKCIFRGQVGDSNLRALHNPRNNLAAETFRTAMPQALYG